MSSERRSLHIWVSPQIQETIKRIATDTDIQTRTKNPTLTGTASEILDVVCELEEMPGVDKLKAEGFTLKQIIRRGVFRQLEDI